MQTNNNIISFLSGLTQGYYGAFWERVDEVRCEDHNIMYTSTTGTDKDITQHIDLMFQYGVGGRVFTSDTKGPRKTRTKDRYCDDIVLEFVNRNGNKGSLFGDQDYINYYVLDDNNQFWLYQFNRQQLADWAEMDDSPFSFAGRSKLKWASLQDLTNPRTPVCYSKQDVDSYVQQVYQQVQLNGLRSLDPLVAK